MRTAQAFAMVALLCLPASAHAAGAVVRRFALLAGTNDGGPSRGQLRHAESDARKVAKVLESIGGVDPGDSRLVLGATPQSLREAAAALKRELAVLRGKGQRTELVFYYSGHSDEEGLLLGGARFDYAELHRALAGIPTDFRVSILDSCSSGAFTRRKGGRHIPAFLVDTSTSVTGQAILTSSAATESSQESDRLGGSFFTHHLLSGLRGAADHSRDGKVTLNEAYQFAFEQTLARTERTQAGAQHPSYFMEVAGTGDVVITDLRGSSAGLILGQAVEGQIFVRDAEGRLIAEFRKRPDAQVVLGLEAGRYALLVARDERAFRADVTVVAGRQVSVGNEAMRPLALESYEVRGDPVLRATLGAAGSSTVFPGRLAVEAVLGAGLAGGTFTPALEFGLDHRWEVLSLGLNGTYLPGNRTRGGLSFIPHLSGRVELGSWDVTAGGGIGLSMFDPLQWGGEGRSGVGVAFQGFVEVGRRLTPELDLVSRFQLTLSPEPPLGSAPFASLGVGVRWRLFPEE